MASTIFADQVTKPSRRSVDSASTSHYNLAGVNFKPKKFN